MIPGRGRRTVAALAVAAACGVTACAIVSGSPASAARPVVPVGQNQALIAELPQPQGPAADPAQVRKDAKEITSEPEYKPPEKSLQERAQEELSRLFSRAFNALSGGGVGSAAGWICLLVIVGGLAFLIVRYGRTAQRVSEQKPEVTVEVHRSRTEWRTEAEKLEARGEWKEALRCRYREMVTDLVDHDVVPDIPGRTVGEHRRDVREVIPSAAADFSGAAELFEQAWYGDVPTGPNENEHFRSLSGRVHAEAASR